MTKVNGPKNRALVKRLNVNAYPAILYLRDGQMREYKEARSVARLAAFGRKAWRDVKPVPFYRAPNNWFGRVGGLLSRVPGIAEEGYTSLKHTHGLGDVSILFLVLILILILILIFIFIFIFTCTFTFTFTLTIHTQIHIHIQIYVDIYIHIDIHFHIVK